MNKVRGPFSHNLFELSFFESIDNIEVVIFHLFIYLAMCKITSEVSNIRLVYAAEFAFNLASLFTFKRG